MSLVGEDERTIVGGSGLASRCAAEFAASSIGAPARRGPGAACARRYLAFVALQLAPASCRQRPMLAVEVRREGVVREVDRVADLLTQTYLGNVTGAAWFGPALRPLLRG